MEDLQHQFITDEISLIETTIASADHRGLQLPVLREPGQLPVDLAWSLFNRQ